MVYKERSCSVVQLLDFIALVLAADALTTAWFYGSIFDNWRNKLDKKGGFWAGLFSCPLCLSYHIPWLLLMPFLITSLFLSSPWDLVAKLPIYSIAITDLVHWLHEIRPIKDEEEDGTRDSTTD